MINETKKNLSEQVYLKLVNKMHEGEFKVGELLPKEELLAKNLNVSRTVLREALSRLRQEGVIESKRGTGNRIVNLEATSLIKFPPLKSISELELCYQFRLCIEQEIAFLAAQNADAEDIEKIHSAHKRFIDAKVRGELCDQEDLDFHLEIAKSTKNHFYERTLLSIGTPVKIGLDISRKFSESHDENYLSSTISEHYDIYLAIKNNDRIKAKEKMKVHLLNSMNRLLIGDNPDR